MARRYYSSVAEPTVLSGTLSNSATTTTVDSLSGYPGSVPWTAIIDPDTASEEVVEVTNVSGTVLTITRGVDGTAASTHDAGAEFRHGVSGRDFNDANAHVNDSLTDVHPQYLLKDGGTVTGTITVSGSGVFTGTLRKGGHPSASPTDVLTAVIQPYATALPDPGDYLEGTIIIRYV
jgi:hypothetical protein